MIHLSDFDPARPPVRPGDRVRLRPVSDWKMGRDDGARPVRCEYDGPGGARQLDWHASLDAAAGLEVEACGPDKRTGLPTVAVPMPGMVGVWSVHPDWLEAIEVADPAGPPCVCDDRHLFYRGCTCGRMAREREARRLTRSNR